VALGTVETFGMGVACELVSWSFARSGVVGTLGTFGTLVTVPTRGLKGTIERGLVGCPVGGEKTRGQGASRGGLTSYK
jgi:hypothetical protein